MRTVRIRLLCDACMAWHNVETEDDGVETVPVGGQTLDLCGGHRREMQPLLALVAEWGDTPEPTTDKSKRKTSKSKSATPPTTVQDAPAVPVTDEQPTSVRKQRGGARARQRREPTGSGACALCDKTPANMRSHLRDVHSTTVGAVYGTRCPLCEHDGGSPRSLGHHASEHDAHSIPQLFQLAQEQGDPYGVLTSRAAALAEAASS